MRGVNLIIILLLIIPLTQANNYINYNSAIVETTLESQINLVSTGSEPKILEAETVLNLRPLETSSQEIKSLNFITQPQAVVIEDTDKISFFWRNIFEPKITYKLESSVKTKNTHLKLKGKIPYPTDFSSDFDIYTLEKKYIDTNSDIQNLADEIFLAETNLFHGVFKAAKWVEENVNYDLNTLTENVVQKSSWVLENKEGVCDELTNLFISILRAKKIPAKFISGIVYSPKNQRFENHGWAEVYFPGYGWLPFDVTFSQYGWIDITHVKLSESEDSGKSSVEFHWKSRDLDVNLNKLDIKAEIKSLGEEIIPILTTSIEPLRKKVGIGSYVPIKVTVENPTSFYIAASVHLTKAPPLEGRNRKSIFLEPNSIKSIYFLTGVPRKLNDNYIFRSELEASTSLGELTSSMLEISSDYQIISKEEAEQALEEFEAKEEKDEFKNIDLNCVTEGTTYYEDELIKLSCTIKNTGAEKRDLRVCSVEECREVTLTEKEEKIETFKVRSKEKIIATVEDEEHLKYSATDLKIIKIPSILVKEITPLTVNYGDEIELDIELEANLPAYNTIIYLGKQEILNMEKFQGTKSVILKLEGKDLINDIKLTMEFEDELGQKYEQKEKYLITVKNRPWYTYLYGWML